MAVAVLCDQALQDKDGVISLIRIVDKLTGSATDTGEMQPFVANLTLALMLKAGEAEGRSFTVRFHPVDSQGHPIGVTDAPIQFAAEQNAGVNVLVKLTLQVAAEGLHWIDVLLDDERLTRIPFLVEHQRSVTPTEPAPAPE